MCEVGQTSLEEIVRILQEGSRGDRNEGAERKVGKAK